MKDAIVRARVDAELKEKANAVLEANALDMSDAIRIFLRQVVRCGGLPFAVRDRTLSARGEVPPESMLMLRPERLKGARVEWPDDSLLDE